MTREPFDAAALTAQRLGVASVQLVEATGSTNADLLAAAGSGLPEIAVLATDYQGQGRGRIGRPWSAPPRSSVMVSLLLRPDDVPFERWPLLSLLAGVAVADTVREVAGIDCGLKWPNDLLAANGRKLVGILAETSHEQPRAAVVGIGLNVTTTAAELAELPTATSLALADARETNRSVLLAALVSRLVAGYQRWRERRGDDPELIDAYRERCVTLGQQVRAELSDDRIEGTASGIGPGGELLIETSDGPVTLRSGEVVHLRSRS